MSNEVSGWMPPKGRGAARAGVGAPRVKMLVVIALVSGLRVSAAGQGPGGKVLPPMEPYPELAGCSEEPAKFHQCASAKAKAFNPPRTPDGKPNIGGFWTRAVARGTDNIEEHGKELGDSGGTSQVIDPPDGKIPYQPWALETRRIHLAGYHDPANRCAQPAIPRQAYTAGMNQIIQSPTSMIFLNDYAHSYRVVALDGRPHLGPNIRLEMGNSRGRWDGNTLVIDVTNQNGTTWFDHAGNFFSDAVHVVERMTLFDTNAMYYEAVIDDPKVYTRPWTLVSGMRRSTEPNYETWENACHEGSVNNWRSDIGMKHYFGVTLPK